MNGVENALNNFNLSNLSNLPRPGIMDILDIIIVAYLTYKIIFWVKETRAWILFKGVMIVVAFTGFSIALGLNTVVWILSKTISVGIIAVVIIFQPELRKALEQIGNGSLFSSIRLDFQSDDESVGEITERNVDEIIKAMSKMSQARTGALILIEQGTPLGDYERTGISLDAVISSQLIINIFEHNTPLHDGAVIIRNNRISAATCFLPLSDNSNIDMALGTRHRAAIGVSEVSDAFALIVSEETGDMSLARNGIIYRKLTPEVLKSMILNTRKTKAKSRLNIWKGRRSDE